MCFPARRFDIILPLLSRNYPLMRGVEIPEQGGEGRPHIMGKARHELAVGLLCLPYNGKPVFIGYDDFIYLIGNRRCQLICCG